MKKWIIPVFAVLVLAQLAVPFSMIAKRERVLQQGERFRFQTRPIDPADPFQGRYVTLRFKQNYIPAPESEADNPYRKQKIYALLDTDEDGFAQFSGWSHERPAAGHYLKTNYRGPKWNWDNELKKRQFLGLRIDLPFDRYYMNEEKAPEAERLARRGSAATNCWASVRIYNGNAVIEDVLIEGTSVHELTQ